MKCVRRWRNSLAGRHQAALWRNSWPAELEKGKFLTRKTTKENHLAKDTRREAKTIVVTLEDNHSLRHLKIIVVKRQMIKIASLRMKCAPSRLTAALHIVQSLLLQMITHPWKYYCTMIDRVSIFEMSKFCFSQGLQNWQHEHLQLILLFGYNWSPITSVHKFCFGRYIGEEHILLLWRCFSVFCASLNYMCFMLAGVEMCFVLADAAVFCGAECSEEPLWWGGDASRVRRGYTDVPAEESAPTWYFPTKV